MTEEEIYLERAELYAQVEEAQALQATRCLEAVDGSGKRWLFPESEVRLLLPEMKVTRLPAGVGWGGLPCLGLVMHGLATLPLFCWRALTGARESEEEAFLVLRHAPVALRVPGPVKLAFEWLDETTPEDNDWSRGQIASEASIAKLERFRPVET